MLELITGYTIERDDTIVFHLHPELIKQQLVHADFWLTIEGYDFHSVPRHLLYLPAILNLAPVVWISNLHMSIKDIDKEFENSLNVLKESFKKLYPSVQWNGSLTITQYANEPEMQKEQITCALFSGGVDSVNTVLSHYHELPTLVTIKGSDIPLQDIEGWKIVQQQTKEFAEIYHLNYKYIISNFVAFLNHEKLNSLNPTIPNWWGYIQHGMGLAGLVTPFCNVLYIASTYSDFTAWGSHPEIDNHIKSTNFNVIHDSFPMTRQEKIMNIIEKSKLKGHVPTLRVCYTNERSGKNCCKCEKCLRTISGLLCNGEQNIEQFGFNISSQILYKTLKEGFRQKKFIFSISTHTNWQDIQSHIKPIHTYENLGYERENINTINWIAKYDFNFYSTISQQHTKQRLLRKKYYSRLKQPFINNKYTLSTYLFIKNLLQGTK